jgi:RNA polymerase sigma-70 factor (ECF subfamily)
MTTSHARSGKDSRETPEAVLIERCQRGDTQAFDELMARYETKVYNLAYRLLGDAEEAYDIAQETFLRVYRALPRFRGGSTLHTWIHRIVVNLCLDEMKKRRRRPQLVQESPPEEEESHESLIDRIPDETADPEELTLSRERQLIVRQAIASLPPHHRAVIVLYDLEGLAYNEVADVLKINIGTVKSRLNRARLALKEKLEPYRELFE